MKGELHIKLSGFTDIETFTQTIDYLQDYATKKNLKLKEAKVIIK